MLSLTSWVFLTAFLISHSDSQSNKLLIRIGGLFESLPRSSTLRQSFEFAIQRVNRRPGQRFEFSSAAPTDGELENVFDVSKEVCRQLKSQPKYGNATGVAAMFGPSSDAASFYVGAVCEKFYIPHIHFGMSPEVLESDPGSRFFGDMSLTVGPDRDSMDKAFYDFVIESGWTEFTIVYESTKNLALLRRILAASSLVVGSSSKPISLSLIQCEGKNMDKVVKGMKGTPGKHKRIIIDLPSERVRQFLQTATIMDLTSTYHHYMFTTLDLDLLDISEYSKGGVNITAYRLIDPESPQAQYAAEQWAYMGNPRNLIPNNIFMTDAALIIDGVSLLARAVDEYLSTEETLQTKEILCSRSSEYESIWRPGRKLFSKLTAASVYGLSGPIRLDGRNRRKKFRLDFIEYNIDGELEKSGSWEYETGLNLTKTVEHRQAEIIKDLKRRELKIVTKLEDPFVSYRTADDDGNFIPEGDNRRFYGFSIDMLTAIAASLNFTYKIHQVKDGGTGMRQANNSWTGMIGEVIREEADIAVAALTINYERSQAIDFTKPFVNLGISILFKRPEPEAPRLFSFLDPLHIRIWFAMLGSYTFVSIFMFFVARFSPGEWNNPHPCNQGSDELENDFSMLNSFWFTIGSLMQQGSDLAPKATSTRIVAGVWWFFTLIMISSYTANLAAFLTITRMSSEIDSADDLAQQTKIKYGCYYGGSTYSFFKNSEIPTFERMWDFMSQHKDDVFLNSSNEGIARVKRGGYAYLMESVPLRYQLTKHCDLIEVGSELDSKGYGLGVRKGSPFRDALSNVILSLSERQVLLNLYNKWWNVGSTKCPDESEEGGIASQLGLANLGGVFVFLAGGLVLAVLVLLIEMAIGAWSAQKTRKLPLREIVREQIRIALAFWKTPSEVKEETDRRLSGGAEKTLPSDSEGESSRGRVNW